MNPVLKEVILATLRRANELTLKAGEMRRTDLAGWQVVQREAIETAKDALALIQLSRKVDATEIALRTEASR